MMKPSSPVPLEAASASWVVYSAAAPAGQVPAAPRLPLAFEPFLFLEPAHQALQQHGHPVLGFFLEDKATSRTVAQFYVVLDFDGVGLARSPGQASFGGVQLAAGLPIAALHTLLDAAEVVLRQQHQRLLEVRPYASCYDPGGAATLAEALGQRGYAVVLTEENCHLATARDYQLHLHPSERRRLRRCQALELIAEQESPLLLPWAYEFIARCRAERGYALSLPFERLQSLFKAFPKQHLLFSVRKPTGDWAALTIAVQASEHVLYNFYPASPLADNQLSPVVLLNESLHTYARASGVAIVDLGTSTLPTGIANEPLLRFKRHLGSVVSEKVSWKKILAY